MLSLFTIKIKDNNQFRRNKLKIYYSKPCMNEDKNNLLIEAEGEQNKRNIEKSCSNGRSVKMRSDLFHYLNKTRT